MLHTGGSLRLVQVNGIFDIQGTPLTLTNRCAAYFAQPGVYVRRSLFICDVGLII